jgi:hypothetical protein
VLEACAFEARENYYKVRASNPSFVAEHMGMRRPRITGTAKFIFAAWAAAALAGCGKSGSLGSFDQPDGNSSITSRFGNLLSFNKLTGEPAPAKEAERLECPEILVLDGTAAHRVYNGAESNENLRYQYSISDVARECIHQGDQIAMKIGVAGQVLLGPTGAPGAFTVPIRIAIVRETDNAPVVSKLYTANVNVIPGQTEAPYTLVTEPLLAPFIQSHTAEDYSIKVGIDAEGQKPAVAHERKKRS